MLTEKVGSEFSGFSTFSFQYGKLSFLRMHLSLNCGQFYILRTRFSNRVSLCYLLGSMSGHGELLSALLKMNGMKHFQGMSGSYSAPIEIYVKDFGLKAVPRRKIRTGRMLHLPGGGHSVALGARSAKG